MSAEKKLDKRNGGKAWWISIICIFCGAMFAMTLQKIPPVMGLVIPYFGIGAAQGGTLISICSLMGVIMAVPAGALVYNFGPRKIGIAALAVTMIGTIMGTFCTSYSMMCVSRVVEGLGFGCCNVICPTVIEQWFEGKKRGMPMALWSAWMSFGILMAFNFANLTVDFSDPGSWKHFWWFAVGLLIVCLVLFIIFVRLPNLSEEDRPPQAENAKFVDGLKSPATWLLGVSFMMFGIAMAACSAFGATYCTAVLGIDPATANSYTSLLAVGCIIGGFVMGFLLDKFHKQRLWILLISMILTAICCYFIFKFQASWAVAFYLVGGFILQMVPAAAFTLIPDTALNTKTISVAMSVVIILENLGPVTAPIIIGAIMDATGGFGMATVFLCCVGVFGIIITIIYMIVQRRLYAKKAAAGEEVPEY